MSEDAQRFALAKRQQDSENAKRALAAFDTSDDVFTTCRTCGKMAKAARHDGAWKLTEHECGSTSI